MSTLETCMSKKIPLYCWSTEIFSPCTYVLCNTKTGAISSWSFLLSQVLSSLEIVVCCCWSIACWLAIDGFASFKAFSSSVTLFMNGAMISFAMSKRAAWNSLPCNRLKNVFALNGKSSVSSVHYFVDSVCSTVAVPFFGAILDLDITTLLIRKITI